MIEVHEGKSIQAAIDSARTGEVIEVHEGIYHEVVRINKPLSVMGYGAVIDGKYMLPQGKTARSDPKSERYNVWEGLVDIISNGIVFDGFSVRNSLGRTVRFYQGASDNIMRNCSLGNGRGLGILLHSDGVANNLIDNVEIYDMSNFAPYARGAKELDWEAGIIDLGINTRINNSKVYENWGEGVILGRGSEGGVIQSSEVYDNYALQIYANHAIGIAILNNNCWFENPEFYRNGRPSFGIVLANEGNFTGHLTKDVRIEGNTVKWCGQNIGLWNPVENVMIRNNTLIEAYTSAVRSFNSHKSVQILDNTIYQKDESKIWNLDSTSGIIREGNIINPEDTLPSPDDHQEILDRLDALDAEQAELSVRLQAQEGNIEDLAQVQAAQADRIERHLKE